MGYTTLFLPILSTTVLILSKGSQLPNESDVSLGQQKPEYFKPTNSAPVLCALLPTVAYAANTKGDRVGIGMGGKGDWAVWNSSLPHNGYNSLQPSWGQQLAELANNLLLCTVPKDFWLSAQPQTKFHLFYTQLRRVDTKLAKQFSYSDSWANTLSHYLFFTNTLSH